MTGLTNAQSRFAAIAVLAVLFSCDGGALGVISGAGHSIDDFNETGDDIEEELIQQFIDEECRRDPPGALCPGLCDIDPDNLWCPAFCERNPGHSTCRGYCDVNPEELLCPNWRARNAHRS